MEERTEAKALVNNTAECCDTAIRDARKEGVATRQIKAGVREALADLIPLPALGSRAVIAGLIADDASVGHALLFGLEPGDFRWSTQEVKAKDADDGGESAQEL